MSKAANRRDMNLHLDHALADAIKAVGQQFADLKDDLNADMRGIFGEVSLSTTATVSIPPLAGRRFKLTLTIDPEEEAE